MSNYCKSSHNTLNFTSVTSVMCYNFWFKICHSIWSRNGRNQIYNDDFLASDLFIISYIFRFRSLPTKTKSQIETEKQSYKLR